MIGRQPEPGDYVLATRWADGDPNDPWVVGFYQARYKSRHLVTDADGVNFRPGGFERVDKIPEETGRLLVGNIALIEQAGQSVWFWRWHPNQLRRLSQKTEE